MIKNIPPFRVLSDEQECFAGQADAASNMDGNDVSFSLGKLDLSESRDDKVSESFASKEERILDKDLMPNEECEGLGELRFADSD